MNNATPSEIEYRPEDLYEGPAFDVSVGAAHVYYSSDDGIEVYADEEQTYKNVVIYVGSFDGVDYELIIPYESYSSLDVINGCLVNVGASSVQGYMLTPGDYIDISEYDINIYNLQPIYGTTSGVYNYGSRNYQRHYYLDNSGYRPSISYDDTYGNFLVEDCIVYYSASERVYYALFFIIFILGVMLICLRRKH